jgi:FixJ family two-component response regulator
MPLHGLQRLSIFIVDDDDGARSSLVRLLSAHGHQPQAWADGTQFLQSLQGTEHGLAVLDLRMPGLSGRQVHEELLRRGSALKVLYLSAHGDIPTALDAQRRGAVDWIVKGADADALMQKIEQALQAARSELQALQQRQALLQRWHSLTHRERDVAQLVRHGWLNKLVGDELGIGVRTVETMRARVYEKLWVKNAVELDRLLRELGVD